MSAGILWAEAGILVVHVKDVQRRPVSGLRIGVVGDGGSALTGDDGKARIPLAKQTREKTWVSLQILGSPSGKDFMLLSPWDYKTLVPPFANESENFVEVVVIQRGERAALETGSVTLALISKIIALSAVGTPKHYSADITETLSTTDSIVVSKNGSPVRTADTVPPTEQQKKTALEYVASTYGMSPEEVDRAIRAWGRSTTDAYESALATLYEGNYSKASMQLSNSLKERGEKLTADQKALADTAFFLGQSLYRERKYQDSTEAYLRCLQLRPYDEWTIDNLVLSLTHSGDYEAAEPLYQSALWLNIEAAPFGFQPDTDPLLLMVNNRADYVAVLPLYRHLLRADEQTHGPNHPYVGAGLTRLGNLMVRWGHRNQAAPFLMRARTIFKKSFGTEEPTAKTAGELMLGRYMNSLGHPEGEEDSYRRVLAVDEKAFGPDNPYVAQDLIRIAKLLVYGKGNPAEASLLLRRALAIDEKTLGTDHPATQRIRWYLDSFPLTSSTKPEN